MQRNRAVRGRGRAGALELGPGAAHRLPEVAAAARELRPVGGVDAGGAAERVDLDAEIVGEGGQAAGGRGGVRLDAGVADEGLLGLRRLGEAERGGRDDLDREGREQVGDLGELAAVVGGDHQPPAREPAGHATAARCSATSSAVPFSARSMSVSSCARVKVAPSALPCTSIRPSSPVITKLASVPAALSSA